MDFIESQNYIYQQQLKRISVYYLDYELYKKTIREKSFRLPNHLPAAFIEIQHRYDIDSFTGLIGENGQYINKSSIYLYNFYSQLQDGKKGFFTSDYISFYEILGYNINEWGTVEVSVRRVNKEYFIPNTAFMLMPFGDNSQNEFYKVNIKNSLNNKFNIKVTRADDFLGNDVIIESIYKQIKESEFIIADISTPNKNVFYELGYAAALNKNIIMILHEEQESSFFDRAHIRYLRYNLSELEKFQYELEENIKYIRSLK